MADYYQLAWLTIVDASSPGNGESNGKLVPERFPRIAHLPTPIRVASREVTSICNSQALQQWIRNIKNSSVRAS